MDLDQFLASRRVSFEDALKGKRAPAQESFGLWGALFAIFLFWR